MKQTKHWAIGLSLLGVILILASVIWITVIEPGYEKLPTDLDETWLIDATVTDLWPSAGETQVSIERHQKAIASEDGVLIIKETITIPDEEDAAAVAGVIDSMEFEMGVDRDSRDYISGYGDREREALYAYPIGVKKQDYILWSDTAGSAPYARYTGEDKLNGLSVYTFITDEKNIDYGDHPTLGFPLLIDLVIDEKVEPHTGITVYGESTRTVKVELPEAMLASVPAELIEDGGIVKAMIVSQAYSEETIAEKVSDAKHYKTQLLWATQYGLWMGIGLGILSLLAGCLFFLRSNRSRKQGQPSNDARPVIDEGAKPPVMAAASGNVPEVQA